MHGFGMFAVTEKGNDTAIGIVGHWYPRTWSEREVGWVLFDATHEGKGIAFEAATACIDHAWNTLKWDTIVSYIAHGNDASVALAERLGAKKDHDAPSIDGSDAVYRHPSPAELAGSQIAHGIEMEISHYADPLFKPKGWALD